MLQERISVGSLVVQCHLDVSSAQTLQLHIGFLAEDPEGAPTFPTFTVGLAPLVEMGYVTLHLSSGMPYWLSSQAKNTAQLCACLLAMHNEPPSSMDFLINLDADNVMDVKGTVDIWKLLEENRNYSASYPYHVYKGKGQDEGGQAELVLFMLFFPGSWI